MQSKIKILYFTEESIPTEKENADLVVLRGYGCQVRNSQYCPPDYNEPCDAAAGKVPAEMAKRVPDAFEFIDSFRAKREEELAKLGEEKPPAKPSTVKTEESW